MKSVVKIEIAVDEYSVAFDVCGPFLITALDTLRMIDLHSIYATILFTFLQLMLSPFSPLQFTFLFLFLHSSLQGIIPTCNIVCICVRYIHACIYIAMSPSKPLILLNVK